MAWAAVAVGVGTVYSGYQASKSADKASSAASKASAASLAFEREKLQEWEETFGPIQDSLAAYYRDVSPETMAVIGLENAEREYEASRKRLDESLAQRGLTGSAAALSIESQADLAHAEQRAEIRRDAPMLAAEEKSRFLKIGLGQDSGQSYSSALQQQASTTAAYATQSEAAAGLAIGSAIQAAGRGIEAYQNRPATPTTPTTPEVP